MFIGLLEAICFFNGGTLIKYRKEGVGERRTERKKTEKGISGSHGRKRSLDWLIKNTGKRAIFHG